MNLAETGSAWVKCFNLNDIEYIENYFQNIGYQGNDDNVRVGKRFIKKVGEKQPKNNNFGWVGVGNIFSLL